MTTITIVRKRLLLGFVLVGLSMLTACNMVERPVDTGLTIKPFVPPSMTSATKASITAATAPASCGNEASYTVQGRTYETLSDASRYQEQGMASWYGAEFQGTETAGCERFDMNAFTAAHRTLPLPSFVRVNHLESGKSVIVRVNDRGPFDSEAIIQLSFAAANALGITGRDPMAQVRVEGLTKQASDSTAVSTSAVSTTPLPTGRTQKQLTPTQQKAIVAAKATGESYYIVVNTYASQSDALDMFIRLTSVGLSKTEMASARQNGRNMHQVRIGPLYTQDQIDNVKDLLESNGLATFRVVKVDQ